MPDVRAVNSKLKNIWLAADNADQSKILKLATDFQELKGLKIGLEAFTAHGPELVRLIAGRGNSVFLDLKLHDIPNTMAGAVRSLATLPIELLTVHLSAGPDALRACVEAAKNSGAKFKLVGVSVLTSWQDANFKDYFNCSRGAAETAAHWIQAGWDAGLSDFVCSAEDLKVLRSKFPEARMITPGIRLLGQASGDQARVLDPKSAFSVGADQLVMGRALTDGNAANALEALRKNLV